MAPNDSHRVSLLLNHYPKVATVLGKKAGAVALKPEATNQRETTTTNQRESTTKKPPKQTTKLKRTTTPTATSGVR